VRSPAPHHFVVGPLLPGTPRSGDPHRLNLETIFVTGQ
jgi:hypothetical protein